MRKVVPISMSEAMYEVIVERRDAGCHSSISEYIRSLVRRDMVESRQPPKTDWIKPPRRANDYLTNPTDQDL